MRYSVETAEVVRQPLDQDQRLLLLLHHLLWVAQQPEAPGRIETALLAKEEQALQQRRRGRLVGGAEAASGEERWGARGRGGGAVLTR